MKISISTQQYYPGDVLLVNLQSKTDTSPKYYACKVVEGGHIITVDWNDPEHSTEKFDLSSDVVNQHSVLPDKDLIIAVKKDVHKVVFNQLLSPDLVKQLTATGDVFEISSENYPVSISKQLTAILLQEILKSGVKQGPDRQGYSVHFKDPHYSAEHGGYHPVEIWVDGKGRIRYITDYSYAGQELEKELDWDFDNHVFGQFGRDYNISRGTGLFRTWQANFVGYYRGGRFKVTVNPM